MEGSKQKALFAGDQDDAPDAEVAAEHEGSVERIGSQCEDLPDGYWLCGTADRDCQLVGRWMMAGNAFLPGLFILQLIFGAASIYAFTQGWYWFGIGEIFLILAFTLPVRDAFSHDPKIAVNGEIIEKLQGYTNAGVRILWQIKAGTGCWDDYNQVKAKEENFRKTIEIDPNDHRCIYRYKK